MTRHVSFLILTRAALAVSGVLFWWLAARLYSVEQIGIASSLISACGLIWLIAESGVGAAVTRYWPDHADRGVLVGSLYAWVLGVCAALTLIFCACAKHFVPALSFVSTFGGACAFAVLTLCIGVHQQLDTVLIAAKHTHSVFFKNIAQFFIRIPMLVPFAVFGGAGIFAANCLSAVLPLIALAWGYRYDLVKTPLRFSTEELRAHAGFSGANFLGGVASSVPGLLFPILLSAWASPQEAGFFYIPWMMFSVLMSAVGAVTGMYAVESNHAGNLRPYFRKACVLGFGGAILAMCVFGLFGGEILGMFKKDFSVHSLVILRWLCAALLPCAGLGLYGSVLLFHKRSRTIAVFNVVQLLVLAVVALLFVPSRGAVGVAQAWFLTSVIMMLFVAIKTFWNAICLKKTYADSFLS